MSRRSRPLTLAEVGLLELHETRIKYFQETGQAAYDERARIWLDLVDDGVSTRVIAESAGKTPKAIREAVELRRN